MGHTSIDANNNSNFKLDEEDFDRQNNQKITTTHNNSHRNRILESKFNKRSSTITFNNSNNNNNNNNTNNIDIGVDYINLIFSSFKQSSNNQYLNEMVQLRKGVKLR